VIRGEKSLGIVRAEYFYGPGFLDLKPSNGPVAITNVVPAGVTNPANHYFST